MQTCPICQKNQSLSLALSSFRHYLKIESFHICVSPVQQVGPSCGIAALSSALSAFKLDNHDASFPALLSLAKEHSWTFAGEMFDAKNLSLLATTACSDVVPLVFDLEDDLSKARTAIMTHLCAGRPVLIAYDCDADFFPKKANGKKAHWAVLSGFCLPSNRDPESEIAQEFINVTSEEAKDLINFSTNQNFGAVYFWTLQGKSRLFRAFEAFDLIESNFQLHEADPALITQGYRIPPDGNISNTLSHRAIALTKK